MEMARQEERIGTSEVENSEKYLEQTIEKNKQKTMMARIDNRENRGG